MYACTSASVVLERRPSHHLHIVCWKNANLATQTALPPVLLTVCSSENDDNVPLLEDEITISLSSKGKKCLSTGYMKWRY